MVQRLIAQTVANLGIFYLPPEYYELSPTFDDFEFEDDDENLKVKTDIDDDIF